MNDTDYSDLLFSELNIREAIYLFVVDQTTF
jgi:hypothetical protein